MVSALFSIMRLPAEWELQEAIWLSWPPYGEHWAEIDPARMEAKWAEISAEISHTQCVRINARGGDHSIITHALNKARADLSQIQLYDHVNDDVWCRDHGALLLKDGAETIATDWRFNGWGGQFSPYDQDDRIAEQMAHATGLPHVRYEEVLEGGAIEANGAGTLLTTEAVLLNPNRNPHLNKEGVEEMFRSRLGISETIWLNEGIEGDDTGGHVDDIARFVNAETILLSSAREGRNKEVLAENAARLSETRFQVQEIPMPEACAVPGWRLPLLPASYVNFLITNELVLVPTFNQKQADDRALGIISDHFPTRKVVGINCLELVREGGALHCISMQQPV